jgi:transposase-like protein
MAFKKYTDNEKQQMAAEYANGVVLKELAGRFAVSIPTMAKYVRAGGGAVRKPGTIGPVRPPVAVEPGQQAIAVPVATEPVVAQTLRVLLSME